MVETAKNLGETWLDVPQTHSALLPQQVDAFETSAMAARFAWLASRLLQN
jgi:hypothetical protein